MKLNKEAIKSVIKYLAENQTFDLKHGTMNPIRIVTIIEKLSENDENKKQEIACAIVRCINEGLIISNYKHPVAWNIAEIIDVTFKGFDWVENK